MEFSPSERDYLAAAIYGEARGESVEGQQAIAWSILNRAAETNQTVEQVVRDASASGVAQFSAFSPRDHNRAEIERAAQLGSPAWTAAQQVASEVLLGDVPDPTNGATHYYAPDAMRQLYGRENPAWGRGHSGWKETTTIGNHVFGNAAGAVPNPPNTSAVPPLNFGEQPDVTPPRREQPNPQGDLNQRELANIAPPTPANAMQMAQARTPNVPNPTARPSWAPEPTPVAERSIAGARDAGAFVLGPNTHPIDTLSQSAQGMLRGIQQLSGVDGITINNGYRSQADHDRLAREGYRPATRSQHRLGNAVDLSLRGMTPEQRVDTLNAAIRGGARGIGATDTMLHVDTRPSFQDWGYSSSGRTANPASWVNQSQYYDNLSRGARFHPDSPTANATAIQGDGSLDAVPGITPRQDPRDVTLPVAMPQPSRESMVQNYGQRALQTSPASLPQMAAPAPQRPTQPISASGGSNTTARINQGFNDALAPRSMPSAIARVSPQGSYGTPRQQNSPDQFQYATRPTPAPSTRMETRTREVANPAYTAWESTQRASNQRSPTDFQYAPSGPSMSTMAANYGARALQGADPFANAAPAPPQTITERYQVSVPNPVARPNMAAPTPRGPQFAGVPNPVARPSSLPQRLGGELAQAFEGFNDWVGDRLPTLGGAAIGGALGGPLGALVGGLGGYGMQQVMGNQGGNNGQPMNINPAPVQNINNPAWSNPIFGVSQTVGQGDSAHDAFYDSQYGSGGFAW